MVHESSYNGSLFVFGDESGNYHLRRVNGCDKITWTYVSKTLSGLESEIREVVCERRNSPEIKFQVPEFIPPEGATSLAAREVKKVLQALGMQK